MIRILNLIQQNQQRKWYIMNRIVLTFKDSTQIEAPIQEDFQIETSTEFTSFSDLCGTISNLVDLANTVSTTSGAVSQSGLMLRSIIDAQRWSKTNPIKINLDMFFYTKDNARENVVEKVNILLGLHLLRHDPKNNNRILVPGINAGMIASIEKEIKAIEAETNIVKKEQLANKTYEQVKNLPSTFFAVTIPGVVHINNAFMFAVKPTYSKQVTKEGFPLWASVNVDICGIAPAFVEDFEAGSRFYYSRLAETVVDTNEGYIKGI